MSRTHVALFVLSSLLPACRDRRPEVPTPAIPAATSAPAGPPVPAGVPTTGLGRLSIVERLDREAQTRPVVRPRAETLAEALAARGIPLGRWKQVLASPIGARFCMAGQTTAGTVVAVCEFGNETEAAAGLAHSRRTFDAVIPNRSLVQRGPIVLTVTRPQAAPLPIGEVDRVKEIFVSL